MKQTVSGGKVDGPISAADSQSIHIDKVIVLRKILISLRIII